MKLNRSISTVEVHTGGEAFRIVTSGLPRLPGDTIVQRRAWLKKNADEIRRALMFEPRGHADMYGGYLTEPVSPSADFGVIFLHNEGYSDHCGHGVIALATAAVELGWVQRVQPETRVGIDAPCGFIEAFVKWDGEHASGVRFVNVPSFIWQRDVSVDTPSFGTVTGDIAYGGAFYFYTDGAPFDREVDRSPTGSGTGGRVAQLYQRGLLKAGETLVNESIVGTIFKGRVLRETKVGEFPAVIPEVEGSAYICGFANWVIDERDPLTYGFLVR